MPSEPSPHLRTSTYLPTMFMCVGPFSWGVRPACRYHGVPMLSVGIRISVWPGSVDLKSTCDSCYYHAFPLPHLPYVLK